MTPPQQLGPEQLTANKGNTGKGKWHAAMAAKGKMAMMMKGKGKVGEKGKVMWKGKGKEEKGKGKPSPESSPVTPASPAPPQASQVMQTPVKDVADKVPPDNQLGDSQLYPPSIPCTAADTPSTPPTTPATPAAGSEVAATPRPGEVAAAPEAPGPKAAAPIAATLAATPEVAAAPLAAAPEVAATPEAPGPKAEAPTAATLPNGKGWKGKGPFKGLMAGKGGKGGAGKSTKGEANGHAPEPADIGEKAKETAADNSKDNMQGHAENPPRVARAYSTLSMVSDGDGPLPMQPVGQAGPDGKVRRVKVLPPEVCEQLKAMTDPKELDAIMPGEAKRQREALRRKLDQQGLRPGLVEKFTSAKSNAEKFELLKMFIMDPSLDSVEIETSFVEQSKEKSKGTWVEYPLCELEKKYDSPEDRQWLKERIVDRQCGVPHPQDPENPVAVCEQSKALGTSIRAAAAIPKNKAMRQSVVDHLQSQQAEFQSGTNALIPAGAAPNKKEPKGKAKAKKELTQEEKDKKEFQKDLAQLSTLADKARTTAHLLTSSGISNQEENKKMLGNSHKDITGIVTEINDMVFQGQTVAVCHAKIKSYHQKIEAIQKNVSDAETIVHSFQRRQAAEKRKAEGKCKAKAKKKAKGAVKTEEDSVHPVGPHGWDDEEDDQED